jgi:hypothetical protein
VLHSLSNSTRTTTRALARPGNSTPQQQQQQQQQQRLSNNMKLP